MMKKVFGGLAGFIILAGLGAYVITQGRTIGYNIGYQPTQPVAYSHKLHAGELGIDCKYCHYAADKGRHAGIPPTELCLNCHSKVKTDSPEIQKLQAAVDSGENIQWVKVHHFPDHAYFNHAQHVNVAGFDCQKCHGAIEEMEVVYQKETLAMGWCINCHRENGIAPPKDHKSKAGGDCNKCHH